MPSHASLAWFDTSEAASLRATMLPVSRRAADLLHTAPI